MASAVLEFANGTSTFTCSTQMADHKRAEIFGSKGQIGIENPFTPPPDKSTKIILQNGGETKKIAFAACDNYTIRGHGRFAPIGGNDLKNL